MWIMAGMVAAISRSNPTLMRSCCPEPAPPDRCSYIEADNNSVPKVLNCSSACSVASCPDETSATTEAVPTNIPSIASTVRKREYKRLYQAALAGAGIFTGALFGALIGKAMDDTDQLKAAALAKNDREMEHFDEFELPTPQKTNR